MTLEIEAFCHVTLCSWMTISSVSKYPCVSFRVKQFFETSGTTCLTKHRQNPRKFHFKVLLFGVRNMRALGEWYKSGNVSVLSSLLRYEWR
jgi:hypothetical protein